MIDTTMLGRIAVLRLDRPAARNALRIADWHRLAEYVRDIDPTIRVMVLHGGESFCAGADLRELQQLATETSRRAEFREAMSAGIEAVAAAPITVIAAIEGGCYGAGVALALAADLRVAGRGARFATTPAKLGIGYPARDVARLIDRVGRGWTSRMLLGAQPVGVEQALAIGLVEEVADDALAAAMALAEEIAANAPSSTRLIKQIVADPDAAGHDAAFDAAFGGADFAEGIAAFAGRRPPVFR